MIAELAGSIDYSAKSLREAIQILDSSNDHPPNASRILRLKAYKLGEPSSVLLGKAADSIYFILSCLF